MIDPAYLLPVSGLAAGFVLGFIARRNFFCTMSSLEQFWYGGNSTGVRIWVLATTTAIILTQILTQLNLFTPQESFYLAPKFGWIGAVIGGVTFGIGMALVGTCGYGALVRMGGGSLKSFVAVLVLALVAMSTQKGLVAISRPYISEPLALDFSSVGSQSIPDIIAYYLGDAASIVSILLIVGVLLVWIFKDADFRSNWSGPFTGVLVGTVIAFGWLLTTHVSNVSFDVIQIESASFVAPVADTVFQFSLLTSKLPDYGVGMVIGVILGSATAAKMADNVQWEACDDARELSRHLVGAAMMGFGGVLASGCTIGQGVSAASVLSISAPIVMVSILLGARMGLSYLFEGSMFAAFKQQ